MFNQNRRRWKLRYTLLLIAVTAAFFIFTTWYVTRREPSAVTRIRPVPRPEEQSVDEGPAKVSRP